VVIRVPDQRTAQGAYARLDDRMLVLDFQAGQPEAFVEIHRRYGALARHVCLRFLPNQADADEAFQETMIRVFQGLYRFNGRYALAPWIARIAKNVSLDILRSRARRPQADHAAPDEEIAAPDDEADAIVERLVARDTVLQVLADLPETHRQALVLREIEGRSHREIAHEMEMTTSQAKALIHRAKSGFRKRWLERVADQRGWMAIALLPLLWLARFGNGFKRILDRVGAAAQTAQVAAPEAVVSVTAGTAAPAAAGMGERLVAAGMTLLLAGGVTVGAAKIVRDGAEPERSGTVAEAAVPVVVPVPIAPDDRTAPVVEEVPEDLPRSPGDIVIEPVLGEPAPVVEPSPVTEPEPSPVVDPSPEPPPAEEPVEPTPPPPPPSPPAYQFDFGSSLEFSGLCPCVMAAAPTSSAIGVDQGLVTVRQSIDARAVHEGQEAYDLRLEFDATTSQVAGSLSTSFYVSTPSGGWYAYSGTAQLASATPTEHGVDYVLQGTFRLLNTESLTDEVPVSGSLTVTLRVWHEGDPVLYGVGVNLGS
jgi:RNA polymerase sigma-70 factor (ECF subfamily)